MSRVAIRSSLALWSPEHRPLLIAALVVGLAASGLVYAENVALSEATDRLVGGGPAAVALLVFAVLQLTRAALTYLQQLLSTALEDRGRRSAEQGILRALLEGDGPGGDQQPGAVINRLNVDVARACGRRELLSSLAWSAFLSIGSVAFFVGQSVLLGVIAVTGAILGIGVTQLIMRPVKRHDEAYLHRDDHAKATFAELLGARAEARAADLTARFGDDYRQAVEPRTRSAFGLSRLRGTYTASGIIATLLTMIAMVVVAVGVEGAGGVAVIPAIVLTVPQLFANSRAAIYYYHQMQLGTTSIDRLAEFDGGVVDARPASEEVEPVGGIELQDIGYRYLDHGERVGGIEQVSVTFADRGLYAVVGPSGCGKSTLVQCLLGLLPLQAGTIRSGRRVIDPTRPAIRARLFGYMPQLPAMFRGSIADNLRRFHRREIGDDELLAAAERTGFARILIAKALEERGVDPFGDGTDPAVIRRRIRSELVAAGLAVRPYEDTVGTRWSLAERLLGSILDVDAAYQALHLGSSTPVDDHLDRLAAVAREWLAMDPLFRRSDSVQTYNTVAGTAWSERAWRSVTELASGDGDRTPLVLAALLYLPSDACGDALPPASVERIAAWLAPFAEPLALDRHCRHLSLRENLLLGAVEAPNRRARDRADRLLVAAAEAELGPVFARAGLGTMLGSGGEGLSGGQRQLLALTRTVLGPQPILVLDEPTSALDPALRAEVDRVLAEVARERCVIAITHDAALMEAAQTVVMLANGTLAGVGSHRRLLDACPPYRELHGRVDLEAAGSPLTQET